MPSKDEPIQIESGGRVWSPENNDGEFHGPVSVRQALARSINVPAVRAAQEVGIESVAVFSEADRRAAHVLMADRAVAIGPAPAAQSYLVLDRIIEACRETGADAVHPGYGFLSENAELAEACARAGITFIGPPAPAIRLMGSKTAARAAVQAAGTPVVPGDSGPAGAGFPDAEIAFAQEVFGLTLGTNFQDPHHPEDGRRNVLLLADRPDRLAGRLGLAPDAFEARLSRLRAALLAVRDRRERPRTDDKVLAGWNGLMIAGLADGGRVLEEPRYVEAARRAAGFVLASLRGEDGTLLRSWRAGQARIGAFLEDYALLIRGLLALHRATGERHWLDRSAELASEARSRFGDASRGLRGVGHSLNRLLTADTNVQGVYDVTPELRSTTTVGAQFFRQKGESAGGTGRSLPLGSGTVSGV